MWIMAVVVTVVVSVVMRGCTSKRTDDGTIIPKHYIIDTVYTNNFLKVFGGPCC